MVAWAALVTGAAIYLPIGAFTLLIEPSLISVGETPTSLAVGPPAVGGFFAPGVAGGGAAA
jgi:hypothetical protein